MKSRMVTVEIETEVFYDEVVDKSYGEDADGKRGVEVIERIPTTVQVLTKVPKECEPWLKAAAIEKFEDSYVASPYFTSDVE